jgi:hypothetical protein
MQLDNSHLRGFCTKSQFSADACPPTSVIGRASATTPLLDQPLTGNAYIVAGGNPLPDILVALRGQIDVNVRGVVSQPNGTGLQTSFETIPDVFVSKFTLNLQGGAKGLLVNNTDICKAPSTATAQIAGQNGRSANQRVALQLPCGSARKARHKRHHKRHLRGARAVG